jgi:hypothetical protein
VTEIVDLTRLGHGRHHCVAKRCKIYVEAKYLMCSTHWRMVPTETRHKVWATYRRGQEETLDLSEEYRAAAQEAIDAVAAAEGYS